MAEAFTKATRAQAQTYAKIRGASYAPALYEKIFDYYFANNAGPACGGYEGPSEDRPRPRLPLLLDVGSGPGVVVFDLLPFFERAIGIDPGEEMIAVAKADARYARDADRTRFLVGGAEECGDIAGIEGQVDIITVAMAAHWFDMPAFYAGAAKALKPGGILAMWTCSSLYAHPSHPAHKELQAVLSRLEDEELGQYATPGNKISQGAYKDLALPWDIEAAKADWIADNFSRHDWDLNGVPSAAASIHGTPGPFLETGTVVPQKFCEGLSASSMSMRWHEANKKKLESGEIEDCVEVAARDLEKILSATDSKSFQAGPSTTLLLIQRAG
ncbi:hypothetical protein MBLNU459_g2036t1 [Dothideomycetes sp. NU459]